MARNEDIDFEILQTIATLSSKTNGWTRELNIISWNGYAPKFDIRDWSPDHDKMGKGITLTATEMQNLLDSADKIDHKLWTLID